MPQEHTTKYLLSKFLYFGVLLMNQKHIPLGIIVKDKKKPFAFGSNNIKSFLQDKIRNNGALKNAFKTDQDDMNLATDYDYYPVDPKNAYSSLIAGLEPSLLPFPVDFMNHEELYKWLLDEIWQDAARRGVQTKSGQVKFKDMRYKPVWWPEAIWPWGNTSHFSKMTKLLWSELGLDYDFVTFMKMCVRACLDSHEINPEDHVDPNHNREILKRRKKKRGIAASPARSSSDSSQSQDTTADDIPLVQQGSSVRPRPTSPARSSSDSSQSQDNTADDISFVQQGSSVRPRHGSSERSENSRDNSDQNENGENDNDSDESARRKRHRYFRRRPITTLSSSSSSSHESRPSTPSIINLRQSNSPPSSINITPPSASYLAGALPLSSSAPSSQSFQRSSSSSSSSASSLPSIHSSPSPSPPPSSSPSPPSTSPTPPQATGRRKAPEEFNRRGPRPPPAKPPSRRRRNAP